MVRLAEAPRRDKDKISADRLGDGCGKALSQTFSFGATRRGVVIAARGNNALNAGSCRKLPGWADSGWFDRGRGIQLEAGIASSGARQRGYFEAAIDDFAIVAPGDPLD